MGYEAYVCATALEFYPDDPYACNNMAALALRCGDIQTARQCLNRCAGDPCTLNNLGILCLIDGDSEKARYCFSPRNTAPGRGHTTWRISTN